MENDDGGAPKDSKKFGWPAEELSLKEARACVAEWLEELGLHQITPDLTLVVTELLTNAANASPPRELVELELVFTEGEICVSVSNRGEPFPISSDMPNADSVRGRGLAIVDSVASALEVKSRGTITTVFAVIAAETGI